MDEVNFNNFLYVKWSESWIFIVPPLMQWPSDYVLRKEIFDKKPETFFGKRVKKRTFRFKYRKSIKAKVLQVLIAKNV